VSERLEKKTEGTVVKRIEHRLLDIMGCLIDGKPKHNHKRDNTSSDNKLIHAYFSYPSKRDSIYPFFPY
jgi:hypothetical protein